MRSLGLGLVRLFLGFCHGLRDPAFRAIAFLLALAAAGGSVFYHFAEGWAWIDSIYFGVMALTTVGDANLAPNSALGNVHDRIFTRRYQPDARVCVAPGGLS